MSCSDETKSRNPTLGRNFISFCSKILKKHLKNKIVRISSNVFEEDNLFFDGKIEDHTGCMMTSHFQWCLPGLLGEQFITCHPLGRCCCSCCWWCWWWCCCCDWINRWRNVAAFEASTTVNTNCQQKKMFVLVSAVAAQTHSGIKINNYLLLYLVSILKNLGRSLL